MGMQASPLLLLDSSAFVAATGGGVALTGEGVAAIGVGVVAGFAGVVAGVAGVVAGVAVTAAVGVVAAPATDAGDAEVLDALLEPQPLRRVSTHTN
jgi:hypothetical protein